MRPAEAAFTALLLVLHGTLLNALVSDPENVTVRCEDHQPAVTWDYSHEQPPTEFIVQFYGSGKSFEAVTLDREFDLSAFVWQNEQQYLEYQYINVTASRGPNRSKTVRSKSFSYKRYKTVDIECKLQFPPVKLTVDDSGATLSFENPLHFYKELRTAFKPSSAFLHVSITLNDSRQDRQCRGEEKICIFFVEIPEDAEPCVKLGGWLSKGLQQTLFKETGVCASSGHTALWMPDPLTPRKPSGAGPGDLWIFVVVMLIIFFLVVMALTLAICKYRAWRLNTGPYPDALDTKPLHHPIVTVVSEPRTIFSPVQIIGSRPPPFVPEEEEEKDSPVAVSQDGPVQEAEVQALIPPQDDSDESAESTKTESISLHSFCSEIEVPLYEARPQLLDLDMGDGDTVIGYTGN